MAGQGISDLKVVVANLGLASLLEMRYLGHRLGGQSFVIITKYSDKLYRPDMACYAEQLLAPADNFGSQ